jgi:hypothetical protein
MKHGVLPDLGYAIDRQDPALSRVHCLALPFLLRHNPFIQGLTECAAMAGPPSMQFYPTCIQAKPTFAR